MPDGASQDFDSEYASADERNTWWTERYKRARTFLYGTKVTPPDFNQALALMQAEATTGNGFAMHDLGRMYLSGLGCDKDEDHAQEWFQKAYHAFLDEESTAKKKDYLQYRIGKLFAFGYGVEQDYAQAADWYEQAVEASNPFAAYALGSLYRHGQGVPQDDAEAFQLFEMAASDIKKPNAYAAYELGKMCRDGIGATKDAAAAGEWFAQAYNGFLAIEKNMADDKLYYRLGQMNLAGIGTKINVQLAKQYFEKAAQLDNLDAVYGLGKLHLQKGFANYAPEKAVEYLTIAAERGHESAQYLLGRTYLYDTGVAPDRDKAISYLTAAAGQGNQYAARLLDKINSVSNYHGPVAASAFRLLQQVSQIIQNEIQPIHLHENVDRKLRRKIDEKKQAQGLRQG